MQPGDPPFVAHQQTLENRGITITVGNQPRVPLRRAENEQPSSNVLGIGKGEKPASRAFHPQFHGSWGWSPRDPGSG